MADPVAAFQGWNSSIQGWNTGTWNTNVAYPITATASVNSAAVVIDGEANVSVTGLAGTGSVGAVTIVGEANISPTGVAGTSALGSYFTTNTEVQMTSAIGSTTISGDAIVPVTGLSATGQLGVLRSTWGDIIPSQNSNFSSITPSQTPDWKGILNTAVAA